MYVLHFYQHGQSLKEMTAQEFRAAQEIDRYAYRRVSAEQARRYVKAGCIHETSLWIGSDGKVRAAKRSA